MLLVSAEPSATLPSLPFLSPHVLPITLFDGSRLCLRCPLPEEPCLLWPFPFCVYVMVCLSVCFPIQAGSKVRAGAFPPEA